MKNSFKELKIDELVAKRAELRKKYFDFRFQAVVGHVENPVQARNLRRQIARVETLINGNVGSGGRTRRGSGRDRRRRRSRARRHTVETVQGARNKQTLQGVVKSDKMDKTIVVEITMRKLHPLYKKYVTRSKSIKAHDEKNEAHEGDTVRVVECRPLSRDKRWRLVEVVEKAK